MSLADTDAKASEAYFAAFDSISGSARVERAVEMAEEAKTLAIAGIRYRQPGLSEAQVHAEWLRLVHGEALTKLLVRDAV